MGYGFCQYVAQNKQVNAVFAVQITKHRLKSYLSQYITENKELVRPAWRLANMLMITKDLFSTCECPRIPVRRPGHLPDFGIRCDAVEAVDILGACHTAAAWYDYPPQARHAACFRHDRFHEAERPNGRPPSDFACPVNKAPWMTMVMFMKHFPVILESARSKSGSHDGRQTPTTARVHHLD